MDLASLLRDVPDFPTPGIVFKDITPLLAMPSAYQEVIERFANEVVASGAQAVAGIESRGFLFAAPLAVKLGLPLALVRKPGKLPAEKVGVEYALEYGSGVLELHKDALSPGSRVVIVDDVLATGGTALAARDLLSQIGSTVVGYLFLLEISSLNGRERLHSTGPVRSILPGARG